MNAKSYYELNASLNYPDALFNLGKLHLEGFCVEKNIYTSYKIFRNSKLELSADLNYNFALYLLTCLYNNGDTIGVNYEKSIKYLKKCIQIQNGETFQNNQIN